MREKMPDIAISTDIIVGFPGETDEDFEDTLSIVREARYDMMYSFIYSKRSGTPAAEMEEQIPADVKSERFDRLLAVQNQISLESNKPFEGKVVRVLCEGPSKNNENVYSGRTEGGKIVFFDASEDKIGQFLNIEIERGDTFALYGKIIK
jgi:tRNA-2-methylthio-N6-dimethylallyladenosine synthase